MSSTDENDSEPRRKLEADNGRGQHSQHHNNKAQFDCPIIADDDEAYHPMLEESPTQNLVDALAQKDDELSPLRLDHKSTFDSSPEEDDMVGSLLQRFESEDIEVISPETIGGEFKQSSVDRSENGDYEKENLAVPFPFEHPEWINDVVELVHDFFPNIKKGEQRHIAELFMAIIQEYFPEDMIDSAHFRAVLTQQFLPGYQILLPREEEIPTDILDIFPIVDNQTVDFRSPAPLSTTSTNGKSSTHKTKVRKGRRGKYRCGICKQFKRVKIDDEIDREHICPESIKMLDGTELRLARDIGTQTEEDSGVGGAPSTCLQAIEVVNYSPLRKRRVANRVVAVACAVNGDTAHGSDAVAMLPIGQAAEAVTVEVTGLQQQLEAETETRGKYHGQHESMEARERISFGSRNLHQVQFYQELLRQQQGQSLDSGDDEQTIRSVHEV